MARHAAGNACQEQSCLPKNISLKAGTLQLDPGPVHGRPKHDLPSKVDVLDGKDELGPLVGEGFVELFRLAELLVGHQAELPLELRNQ